MNSQFRTPVRIPYLRNALSHKDSVLMIGSCFSENMYKKLKENQFSVVSNPAGIVYNPSSIVNTVNRLLCRKKYSQNDLFFHDGLWKCFDHHSAFADHDRDTALEKINRSFDTAVSLISDLDVLELTFGSSFVYQLNETGRIVANCHKQPDSVFMRRLLSVDEIVQMCSDLFEKLIYHRKEIRIILTVSPVRHLRDDAHENCVSKSHLISAVYELEKKFAQVYYFGAYELMMDELRDYRFYDSDMLHPSDVAIDFIWDRFCQSCMDTKTNEFIGKYARIIRARNHRMQSSQKEKIQIFAHSVITELDQISGIFPNVDLTDDYNYFRDLV